MSVEIYEGKEAVILEDGRGFHHYNAGEIVKLLFKDPHYHTLYAFTNEEGLHQYLNESNFEWIKEDV